MSRSPRRDAPGDDARPRASPVLKGPPRCTSLIRSLIRHEQRVTVVCHEDSQGPRVRAGARRLHRVRLRLAVAIGSPRGAGQSHVRHFRTLEEPVHPRTPAKAALAKLLTRKHTSLSPMPLCYRLIVTSEGQTPHVCRDQPRRPATNRTTSLINRQIIILGSAGRPVPGTGARLLHYSYDSAVGRNVNAHVWPTRENVTGKRK